MDNKLQDALKRANAEIEKAMITDPELKKVAFSKAVDFYLHGTDAHPQSSSENISDAKKAPDNFWKVLESSSGIEIKKLKDVYAVKGEQILLIVSSVPGEAKADKQRNLAALILFAYHEGLGREWVTSSLLAEAASHSKLYDTSKFAKNLKFDWFRAEGVKKGLKYRLSGPGTNHAKEFLLEITQ
jgi:hypothetical protein